MAHLPTRAFARTARLAKMGLRATGRLAVAGAEGAAVELVDTLGELRGLATKVGQMASYIEGMTPEDPAAARILAGLRSHTVTSDPAEIRAVVERDLGGPIAERFATWSDEPFASASLGQVHRATLPDGAEVAVKVQHPGIRDAVSADLSQMDRVGAVARHVARGVPVEALLEEVRVRLLDELDYPMEAANQAAYAAAFADDADVVVPAVHLGHTGPRVLTTSFAAGEDLEVAVCAPEELRAAWAAATWRLFVGGALRTGLLHGDPHPGNLLFRDDGSLVALDFGCVQPLDPAARTALRALLAGGLAGDVRPALLDLLGPSRFMDAEVGVWTTLLAPLSRPTFRIDRAHARALGAAVRSAKHPSVTFGHRAQVPPWFLLAHRTFLGLVSVLARLDARVDYAAVTREALAGRPPGEIPP